jgi:transcriptional regulator with XRE-family HTH domain
MTSESHDVGQRVQSLRHRRGWTARRLAEECARAGMPSLTRGTLAKIESGVRKSITAEELVALARAFGVPVSALLPSESSLATESTSDGSAQARTPVNIQREAAGGHAQPDSDPAPYFYLSYAHTPRQEGYPGDPDIWVANLYQDLCSHIMQLTDLPPGARPGFMDRELGAEGDWPARMVQALATCRVFVPLYSMRYFISEHCGKEWSAFSRRVRGQATAGADPAEGIVPALWVPVSDSLLPEAAKSLQFDHSQLGERYSTHGFYGIIKLSRYRSEYEEAVYELARRIVQVGQTTPISPEIPPLDYASLDSAFGPADLGSGTKFLGPVERARLWGPPTD